MTLSPRAWRTLYNVADALRPPREGEVAIDLAPSLVSRPREPDLERNLARTLAWLEFEARLRGAPVRGFSWLPRARRRALLESWERSRLASRRDAFARLARAVTPGVDSGQSFPGA